ncbi:hypothetical protein B0T22DRAFT_280402 [Podospora appendiculata]|uniref:Siderophore biosynthesis enzyme n=1 Tax=Podospora appendiculata TaxID=314037 RepID=A0AAE1C816_9PEZI|nr:hypothetical protein B0T22DRAFT_280402 [Podospora appendiculata]
MPSHISTLLLSAALLLAAGSAQARTNLAGCISTKTIVQTQGQSYASLIWYDPGTGEICYFIDCGGGRAAPKTTVPGCVGYQGSETVTPSFLSGFGAAESTATATATLAAGESSQMVGTVVATDSESATGVVESSIASVFVSASASGLESSQEAPSMTAPAGLIVSSSSSSSGVELTTSSGKVTKGSGAAGGGAQLTPTSTSISGLGSGSSTRTSTAGATGSTQTGVVRQVVGLAAVAAAGLAFV